MGIWNIFEGRAEPADFGAEKELLSVQTAFTESKLPKMIHPVLPDDTILRGRYKVFAGDMDYFFIKYHAEDTLRRRTVTVAEYFCNRTACRESDHTVVPMRREDFQAGFDWFEKQIQNAAQMPEGLHCLLDSFQENGTIYAVLETETGYPLRSELPDIRWTPEDLVAALDGAMNAVSLLHSAGFIHRWLGIDTIRTHNGKSTVDCFGNVGKYPDRNNDPEPEFFSEPVRRIFNRWEYPMEYYTYKKPIGPYSAVYVFAAIFARYLTQREPEPVLDRLSENVSGVPQGKLSEPVRAVLEKGMAISPKDRYQTVEEFRWALSCAINQN